MNIILLSGGSGKRLWPLSNEIRSKQFIKLFKDGDGNAAFMVTNITNPVENKTTEVSVELNSDYKGALVIKDGEETLVTAKKGKLDLEIEAGSALFVIPLKEAK